MCAQMFEVDEQFLARAAVDLVQIDSRNPSLSPDGPGETVIGEYVASVLADLGLEVITHRLGSDRVNVVGVLKGTGGGRSLMLNGHLDTVGVAGMEEPFSAAIRDGKLYGRGSQDMKGSLAAMIAAVKALVDADTSLAGDVIVTAVADEEYLSIGTEDIVKHYTADAAIVTEPTDMAICLAHRGFIWYDVETFGRAAHGSRYDEGIDANMRMGRFLARLDKLEQALRQRPPHPLTGPPSLHASIIQGGTEMSIYADHCLLKVERRTIPGELQPQVTQELQDIIDELAEEDPTFKAKVTVCFERLPLEMGADAPIVQVAEAALAKRLGEAPAHTGATFWTDAALLVAAGIDAILLGPVGAGLHSAEEWVDLSSVVDLAHVLAETCAYFCAPRPEAD
jgi:acetylornithine deacetylase